MILTGLPVKRLFVTYAKSWLIVSILALFLPACGYSLRKTPQIDKKLQPVVIISAQKYDPVYQAMANRLRIHNVTISDSITTAQSKLEIFDEREPERETIISTTSGDEELFVLQWRFRFFVRDRQQQWEQLIPDQFISVSKVVNTQQLEQQIGQTFDSVRFELRQRLADRIIRQIDSFILQFPFLS